MRACSHPHDHSPSRPQPSRTAPEQHAPGAGTVPPAPRPLLLDVFSTSEGTQLLIFLAVAFFGLTLLAGATVFPALLYPSLVAGLVVSLGLPGYMLIRLLDIDRRGLSEAILLAVGASVFLLFAAGLLLNVLLPLVGVSRPLSTLPLALLVIFLNLALLAACRRRECDLGVDVRIPRVSAWVVLMFAAPPLLVVGSIMGAVALNNGGSNVLATIVMGAIGLYGLAALLARKKLPGSVFPYALFFMTLAALLSISLRGWLISGHDILYEFGVFQMTKSFAHWSIDYYRDAYNACLSLTILPAMLSGIMPKFPDQLILRLLYQALFALTPVALFLFLRRYLSSAVAFIACLFFISQPPLLQDFAYLTRQELALLFNVLLLLVLSSRALTSFQRYFLAIMFSLSMIWSHYATTYIAVVIFIMVLVLRHRWVTRILGWLTRARARVTTPLLARFSGRGGRRMSPETLAPITGGGPVRDNPRWLPGWIFVLSLMALTMAWNIGVTGTHNNFTAFVGSVYQTVTGRTGLSEYKSGLADQLKIYDKAGGQVDIIDAFVSSRLGGVHTTELARYTPDTYRDYNPRIDTDVRLDKEGDTLAQQAYSGGEIYKKLAKVFLVIGVLWLIFSGLSRYVVDDDFKALMAVSLGILGMALTLPIFSEEYSLLRAFQQLLLSLSLPAVIGAFLAFDLFCRRYALQLTAAFFVVYFLLLSSFLPQVVGFGYAQMNLNNYGIYYDIHYAHESENDSINWLARNAEPETPVYTDFYGKKKMEVFSPRSLWVVDNVLPQNINRDAYVYAGYTNKSKGAAYVPFKGTELNYRFPADFLSREKDVIYTNGETEILK